MYILCTPYLWETTLFCVLAGKETSGLTQSVGELAEGYRFKSYV